MRVLTVFAPLDEPEEAALQRARRTYAVADGEPLMVTRRSLDARKGRPIGFHLEVQVGAAAAEEQWPAPTRARAGFTVVVVGTGPAGTFAARRLVEAGAAVTLVDIGKPVQPRRHDLASLTQRGDLCTTSNYCFGEGGAGTFSDGKLYARSKDKVGVRTVLRALVEAGADPAILIDSRPHIGSNRLPQILVGERAHLEARGARYIWDDGVTALLVDDRPRVRGVRCKSGRELVADAVVLAVGHSARSLYEQLHAQDVALEPKSFAVGARIEHPQPFIDRLQYGEAHSHPRLAAAFYHLTATVPTSGGERGVYSFCMCPGGWVVNSATEPGRLCTNGMSLKRRDSPLANAALVVTVEPRDWSSFGDGPLAGLAFQRSLEERAFVLGGGDFVAATQGVRDFIANRPSAKEAPSTYRPSTRPGDVRGALPAFIGEAIERALVSFERRAPGFAREPAQLVGVETRSSSPVRIVRNESLQSPSHAALFPTGEGAGYAGGIVSAALDGLRVADAVLAL